jgi:hypothetical protein
VPTSQEEIETPKEGSNTENTEAQRTTETGDGMEG